MESNTLSELLKSRSDKEISQNVCIGDVYYHLKKSSGTRRRLRVDAVYNAKGLKGKPDKTIVACTDMATRQPYTPIMVKNFLKNYKSLELTKGESFIYSGQVGRLGGFMSHLYKAISMSDSSNRRKLEKAFPEEVAIFNSNWSFDDIQDKVKTGARLHQH